MKKNNDPICYETLKEPTLKERLTMATDIVKEHANNLKPKPKTSKKPTKADISASTEERKRAILGIGLLLVVVSITFSTYVAIMFVDGGRVYIALAPQIAFAVISLLKAFSKIYK